VARLYKRSQLYSPVHSFIHSPLLLLRKIYLNSQTNMSNTEGHSTDPSTARTSSVGASAPSTFKKKSRFFKNGQPTWDTTQPEDSEQKVTPPHLSTSAGSYSGVATNQTSVRADSDQTSKAVPTGLSPRGFRGGRNKRGSSSLAPNLRATTSSLGSYNFKSKSTAARKTMAHVERTTAVTSGAQTAARSSQSSRATGGSGDLSQAGSVGKPPARTTSNYFGALADLELDEESA